jgi:hypothetical protein
MAKSGMVELHVSNGDITEAGEISTLKPVITSYNPNPVNVDNSVEIIGTDFDLVSEVTTGGDVVYTRQSEEPNKLVVNSETSMSIYVTLANENGPVVLTMNNGEKVQGADLTILKPEYAYAAEIPTSITSGNALKIIVTNVNHLTDVLLNGSSAQYMVSGNMVFVLVPSSMNGDVSVSLISNNGGPATYTVNVVMSADNEEVVLWEGLQDLGTGWDWNSNVVIDAVKFANAGFGSKIKVLFTCNQEAATYYQLKFSNSSGTALTGYTQGRNDWDCAELSADATEYEFLINLSDLAELQSGGMRVGGYAVIVTKVSVINYFNLNTPIQDISYVYFDFNDGTKNSWWGQANVNNTRSDDYWVYDGVENNPALSLDGTPYFRGNNGAGMFFRNKANNMRLDGVTFEDWVVKFDVRVLSGSGAIRLELASGGTQYMAIVNIPDEKRWVTVSVPLSAFVDNYGFGTNALPDLNIDEFGATDGGNSNTMDLCIDNVRFEHK